MGLENDFGPVNVNNIAQMFTNYTSGFAQMEYSEKAWQLTIKFYSPFCIKKAYPSSSSKSFNNNIPLIKCIARKQYRNRKKIKNGLHSP